MTSDLLPTQQSLAHVWWGAGGTDLLINSKYAKIPGTSNPHTLHSCVQNNSFSEM